MSDQPAIAPALTPEEWASDRPGRSLIFTGENVENECCGCGLPSRHALAALALHGQPFGFTREDVTALEGAIGNVYQIHGEWGVGPVDQNDPELMALRSLADRIAALLPPEAP